MKKEFVLIGAGGHAKVIIEIIEESGGHIDHIIDDNPKTAILSGYRVTNERSFTSPVIVAIGDNKIRKKFVQLVNSEFGKHCIINTNASVDHDCKIGDFVHISPKVTLAGNVTVDEGSHIGIGSTVIQGRHIGKWVTIGAGAVIIEDVPDYAVVVGVPGNIIRYNPSLAGIMFEAIVVADR
jgi:acetyltransferase-like isoleucine patch superfamily enzyme